MQTIIIGAGASGLMIASRIASAGRVMLLDAHPTAGAKIAVSGGGRCNVTHADVSAEDYLGDPAFVRAVLAAFGSEAMLGWLAEHGGRPVRQKHAQYFCADTARRLLDLLARTRGDVRIRTGCRVEAVEHSAGRFRLRTERGTLEADRLVVASGGLSYPRLGASDIGYRIARTFGHAVQTPVPALVGLTLQPAQFFLKDLSGLATDVVMRVAGRTIRGRMLLAHRGITGPAVLDASLYWRKGEIAIDFVPQTDLAALRTSPRQLPSLLPMPRRLTRALLEHLQIPDRPCRRLTDAQWERVERLRDYRMAPAGTFGYTKAEVTAGGVATDAIDPATMESRLQPGLFFVGEVLDVTGRLGGYNLQWAWSTAAVCATALSQGFV